MKIWKYIATTIIILTTLSSCIGDNKWGNEKFTETPYAPLYASGFVIQQDENSNTLIRVTKPWQGEAVEEQTLAIFTSEKQAEGYKGQYIVGPAKRIVCMSSSHIAMLDAIDCTNTIVGVSGKQYITNTKITSNDKIKDIGYDSNLDYETLVMLNPDIVLMYGVTAENSAVTAKLRDLDIPYLYLGDYTEESPLGKAEWMVVVAEIAGCREVGINKFMAIAKRYNEIADSVKERNKRVVMLNLPYQDVWYMPSDDSYMVRLVEDAGGQYIYKGSNPTGGSKGISLEEAYMLVSKADLWLNVGQCSSMDELRAAAPHFIDTDVVRKGNIYNNNRRKTRAGGSDFWESAIVNPDVVLADLVSIISGEPRDLYYYHSLSSNHHTAVASVDITTAETNATKSHSRLWSIVLITIVASCSLYAVRSYFVGGSLRHSLLFTLLVVAMAGMTICDLLIGSSNIPLSDIWAALSGGDTTAEYSAIINKFRLSEVLVAIITGMALSASGLLMQTLFRNPLAGPYVLGINSGASLGVALFTLALPILNGSATWLFDLGLTGVAWAGSAAILLAMMLLSRKIGNINVILILGMMLGSAISAIVGILQYMGTDESLKAFVVWTMGSLSNITTDQLYIFVPAIAAGLILSLLVIKPLNMLLMGESNARTMGLRVGTTRTLIFLATTLLAGTVTAYCGPIGFIGLAMPHLARMTFRTADHRILLPASILWGAVAMLLCCLLSDVIARYSDIIVASKVMLPVNTLTALMGVPIIIFVVFRNRNRQ